MGRLWVEEETPPSLDISRGFRAEKRVKKKSAEESIRGKPSAPRMKPKLERSGAVLLSNLVMCVFHKSTGLANGTGPPETAHTHTHTCKVKMDGEGEKREGGLLGACRVRLNPFTAWWKSICVHWSR